MLPAKPNKVPVIGPNEVCTGIDSSNSTKSGQEKKKRWWRQSESMPDNVNVNMLVPAFINTENNQVQYVLLQFSASCTFRITNKMMPVLLSGMKM